MNKTVLGSCLRIDLRSYGLIEVLPRKPKFAACISHRVFAYQPRYLQASSPFYLYSS
ncbi:unnamed protein product, partial [Musa textilis]